MKRILFTGAAGQVGGALATALPARGFTALPTTRDSLDFDRPESITAAFHAARPDAVVSAAAWTAVDAAESNEAAAFRANAEGPAQLAAVCAAAGIPLIHISTDYVFAGDKPEPYTEADPTGPVSAYGRSKLAGEWGVLAANPRTIVLRTAWVYAATGKNFLRSMLALGATRPELRIVADQQGNPTASADLADAIGDVLLQLRDGWRDEYRGIFHATAQGDTTWHGFAAAIFEASAGPRPALHPITTAEYPTPARRPANSRLDGAKLQQVFGVRLPHWRQGLARVMQEVTSA
ncbi:MAG: dTDP-4-dehydrorhamnose reductase [Alphaproteobacteria bacterium]|nr:dTDP-4-dehydrorhamnose reductase [Alphaproteobacteria bacterium]